MSATNPPLSVLFATPECAPWVKTGGLGDVAGALVPQLRRDGVDARVLMPAYRSVRQAVDGDAVVARVPATESLPQATIVDARLADDVPMWLVDCPPLFDRDGGPYQDAQGRDWADNAQRFALLSRVAALLCGPDSPLDWRPAILHCNDWQTAPAAAILQQARRPRAQSLVTIHNLAFQGLFAGDLTAVLGLPPSAFGIDGVEFHGRTSYLKAGLMAADAVSTVSPTYAAEIQRAPLGFGLEGVLAKRGASLRGILNGIDDGVWDPATDRFLAHTYTRDRPEGKAANKAALQRQMGLEVRSDVALFGVVTRLTEQKGSDLIAALAARIAMHPAQLALLGSGDASLERAFTSAAAAHAGSIAVHIGFDESLAHRIEAGADAFLMPSRFEPCGLNQMYSQRYGTPPIARATGGLCDSIVDATAQALDAGTATGFLFEEASTGALWDAIERALALWQRPAQWRALQLAGMAQPFGWAHRAHEYAALYASLLARA